MLAIALSLCMPPLALVLILVLGRVEKVLLAPPRTAAQGAAVPTPRAETPDPQPAPASPPVPRPLGAAAG